MGLDPPGQWRSEGQPRRSRRDQLHLVQRSNRRPDHKAKTRETANVRASETRTARSAPYRRMLIDSCTKIASEPKFDPAHARSTAKCLRSAREQLAKAAS